VQKQFHDVVLSTYGRGIYILDNITPLEQPAPAADEAVHLFTPRPAYRDTRGAARAMIDFSLKAAPRGAVKLEVLDAKGAVIRELRVAGRPGLNRTTWDMHYEAPHTIALRTTPPENPHIWEELRFRGQDTRPITHWGLAQAEVGPVVAPGKYMLRLTVEDKPYTQTLEILRDPLVPASVADLEAGVKFQLRIRDDINATSDMVNHIEMMRKQLEDITKMLRPAPAPGGRGGFGGGGGGGFGGRGGAAAAEAPAAPAAPKSEFERAVEAMDQKLQDVEYKLFSKALRTSDDKYFIQAYKVYLNLLWLNGEVGTGAGDVAGSADDKPTDTAVGLLQDIEKDLDAARAEYKALMDKEVPAFNRMILEKGGEKAAVPLVK
jgi:hypothetical protein